MIFYGLADYRMTGSEIGEIVEFYLSREEAQEALREILTDEPKWQGELGVVPVEFQLTLQ